MANRALHSGLAAALLALAVSGFAALAYQVCWMRLAALVFGSTVYATSTVLAVFFAGLALGGEVAGRVSARLAQPLRAFAGLELCLALLGALSPLAFTLADGAYTGVYDALRDTPAALALVRLVMVLALLLVPATLMGASLPLFTRALAAARCDAGTAISRLYAANTLGALAGCVLAGLVLVPGVGIQRSVLVAAAGNALAALIAFNLAIAPPDAAPADRGPSRARLLGVLVLIAGAVALANEVLWTRYLGLLIHNSVLTYTVSLAAVLAGIVIGSALAPALLRATRDPVATFGGLQVGIGLLVLGTSLLPPPVWQWMGGSLTTCAILLLPPSVLSGASFPLAVHILLPDSRAFGAGIGRLYALNTVGGILGALAAGFLLLPLVGLQGSLHISSGASVAAGLLAWSALGERRRQPRALLAGAAAAGLWLALPAIAGTRVPGDFLAAGRELVDEREGISANVAVVREQGELQLEIDRWWQGSTRKGHQVVAAHVPMLLHPDPRRVLVVGAGAGQTPSRVLLYPVERLDVVDIEPAVFDVIGQHFDPAWMHATRTHLVRDDGRNYVVHGRERYDVIAIEVGQISRPGVASFYTRDFYAHARERLAAGGLLVQFVPLPFFTLSEFQGVLRTFLDVFPTSVLWYNTAELLLIGRDGDDVSVDARRLLEAAGSAEIEDDLNYSHWGGPRQWLSRPGARLAGFLAGPEGLARLAAVGEIYRDDRPVLEYETARPDETRSGEAEISELLRANLESASAVLGVALDPQTAREVEEVRAANLADIAAAAELRRARAAQSRGDGVALFAHLRAGVRANPLDVLAQRMLGDALLAARNIAEAREHYDRALAIDPSDAWTHRGLAYLLQLEGRPAEAAAHYRAVLDRRPDDAEAHNNLGTALASSGDLAGAETHFRLALQLRPGYADAERNLQRLRGSM